MNQVNKQDKPVVLITGSARRIGAAIAQFFHGQGFNVVIHYHHSTNAALALVHEFNRIRPNSATSIRANFNVKNDLIQLIENTILWQGRLDSLINNASVFIRTPSDILDDTQWDLLWNTNVKAPFLLSHLAFSHLAKKEGAIINITDIHAEQPLKQYSIYCQSKAALTMQTKALAQAFGPKVRVNAIAPGAIDWPENENYISESIQKKIIKKTPLQRHGDPLAIAKAVFAIADNTFITGQTLRVDGGRCLF